MKGSVLLALALVLGTVSGQEFCNYIKSRSAIAGNAGVNIATRLTNNAGEVVQEVTNGDKLEVTTIFDGISEGYATCHVLFGQPQSRREFQTLPLENSCFSVPIVNHTAKCVYNINSDVASDGRILVRVALDNPGRLPLITGTEVQFRRPAAGATRPRVSTTSTSTVKPSTSTKKVETDDSDQNEADLHDSKLEAYLAAKYAQLKQKMNDDEDKYSEGTWQRLEADEKRKHEDDVRREMEDYERTMADEKHRREEMIREEMRDKEEHDRIEHEAKTRSPVTQRPTESVLVQDSNSEEVDVDEEIVVGSFDTQSSATFARVSAVSILLALFAALFV